MEKGVQGKSCFKGGMHKRERSEIIHDISLEQGKRLKKESSEKGESQVEDQFQEGQVARRWNWKGELGNRKGLQIGEGCRAFSRLLREEAAEDRRRVGSQRKLHRIIINISLISLGFGLGWILNWENRSLAICQCL